MSPRKVITGKAEKPSPEPRWRGAARPRRRESKAARKERALRLLEVLDRAYPHSHCSLDHRNEFELLIATILSAQCTDARVNMVTPELFRRAPGPAALARLSQEDLEELVKTTGFFRNKAKSIKGAAEAIVAEHGGKVPATMEALLSLPGVARKTANVVLGTGYGIASGVVVDTHVQRISQLLR